MCACQRYACGSQGTVCEIAFCLHCVGSGDAARDFRLFNKHVSPLSLLARPVFELLILWPQALSAGIIGLHQYLSLTFSAPLRVNFQGNLCSVSTSDFEESHTGRFVHLFGFL